MSVNTPEAGQRCESGLLGLLHLRDRRKYRRAVQQILPGLGGEFLKVPPTELDPPVYFPDPLRQSCFQVRHD